MLMLPAVLIEAHVFRHHPTNIKAFLCSLLLSVFYTGWLVAIYTYNNYMATLFISLYDYIFCICCRVIFSYLQTGKWVYSFMNNFDIRLFIIFAISGTLVNFGIFFISNEMCKLKNPDIYIQKNVQQLQTNYRNPTVPLNSAQYPHEYHDDWSTENSNEQDFDSGNEKNIVNETRLDDLDQSVPENILSVFVHGFFFFYYASVIFLEIITKKKSSLAGTNDSLWNHLTYINMVRGIVLLQFFPLGYFV